MVASHMRRISPRMCEHIVDVSVSQGHELHDAPKITNEQTLDVLCHRR